MMSGWLRDEDSWFSVWGLGFGVQGLKPWALGSVAGFAAEAFRVGRFRP